MQRARERGVVGARLGGRAIERRQRRAGGAGSSFWRSSPP